MPGRPTRRAVLLAGPLLLAGACTRRTAPRPPDPDVGLRAAAVAREVALLRAYGDGALAPELAALRQEHQAHLAALGGAARPSSSPAPPLPRARLAAVERTAAAAAVAAVPAASRPLAALLASIAASERTHASVLA